MPNALQSISASRVRIHNPFICRWTEKVNQPKQFTSITEWIRLANFSFTEHLSHTEYVSNDRITITIYNILCHFYLYAIIYHCGIFYALRNLFLDRFFFLFFVAFHTFTYKLKHDRQSCHRQLCHLAGFKNEKYTEPHTHTHIHVSMQYIMVILRSTTSATGFGGTHRNHCHAGGIHTYNTIVIFYTFVCIHFHDRKNSYLLNLERPCIIRVSAVFG